MKKPMCRNCSYFRNDGWTQRCTKRFGGVIKLTKDKYRPDWCPLKEREGKWVEDKQGEHCRLIKCSKCGLTFIVGNNIPYDEWIEDRNYCRRCGARMVKPND